MAPFFAIHVEMRFVCEVVTDYVYVSRGRCERRHTMLFLLWIALLLLIALGTFISTQLYTRYKEVY